MTDSNLSTPRLRVLRALADSPATASGIGEAAGLAGPASAADCDALAAAGLVRRERLDMEGRIETWWHLTPAGREAIGAAPSLARPDERRGKGPAVRALVPLFGSNRLMAAEVGKAMAGCAWVGVPFMGSLAELPYVEARTLVCNDLHRHLVNLARTAADPIAGPALWRKLRRTPLHAELLKDAQRICRAREGEPISNRPDVAWAAAYWFSAWASRNGTAGTKGEFAQPLSARWDAGGGDSAVRLANAASGLREWRALMQRCTFHCMDAFDFLARCKDHPRHGIYCDPPFPGPGDAYACSFSEAEHRRLATRLAEFKGCRIVCRWHDLPLVRELYPEGKGWRWLRLRGRTQTNGQAPEVLVTRNGPEKE